MERQENNGIFGRVLIAVAFLTFAALMVVSFYDTRLDLREITQSPQSETLQNISNNPAQFYGREVSVFGSVDKNFGTRGMLVSADGPTNNKIFVLSKQNIIGVGGGPGMPLYPTNSPIVVSGKVQIFHLKEIEKALGIDLNDEIYAQFEGKPVIIADNTTSLTR